MLAIAKIKFNPSKFYLLPIVLGTILGVLFAFCIDPFWEIVQRLGYKITEASTSSITYNILTDYTTAVAWATFLGACIIFSPFLNRDKYMLLWAWAIKCFVSLFLLLFYESYFDADSPGYWNNARFVYHVETLISEFLMKDLGTAKIFILISYYNDVIPDILVNSYHSLKITFSMMGLMATYLFYRASNLITKKDNRMFFWILLLWPSLLIYTSMIGKEVLHAISMAIFTVGLVNWHFKRKTVYLLVGIAGFYGVAFVRVWVAFLMLFALILYFFFANKNVVSKIAMALILIFLMSLNLNFTMAKFGMENTREVYKKISFLIKHSQRGGSRVSWGPPTVIEGPLDIIKNSPKALTTALFRPLPWDVPNMLAKAIGIEGLIMVYLFFIAVIRTRFQELNDPILIWSIVFVLSWALLYGLVIQNYGTGVRWKTQILPIFLGWLFYLSRHRQRTL